MRQLLFRSVRTVGNPRSAIRKTARKRWLRGHLIIRKAAKNATKRWISEAFSRQPLWRSSFLFGRCLKRNRDFSGDRRPFPMLALDDPITALSSNPSDFHRFLEAHPVHKGEAGFSLAGYRQGTIFIEDGFAIAINLRAPVGEAEKPDGPAPQSEDRDQCDEPPLQPIAGRQPKGDAVGGEEEDKGSPPEQIPPPPPPKDPPEVLPGDLETEFTFHDSHAPK